MYIFRTTINYNHKKRHEQYKIRRFSQHGKKTEKNTPASLATPWIVSKNNKKSITPTPKNNVCLKKCPHLCGRVLRDWRVKVTLSTVKSTKSSSPNIMHTKCERCNLCRSDVTGNSTVYGQTYGRTNLKSKSWADHFNQRHKNTMKILTLISCDRQLNSNGQKKGVE